MVSPFIGGYPTPLSPEMLRLYMLGTAVSGGRGVGGAECASFASCKSKDGSEVLLTEGGVNDPEVGVAPLPPASLELSVECSVRKLALDRRLSSLKLKRDEGMRAAWSLPFLFLCLFVFVCFFFCSFFFLIRTVGWRAV